MPKVRTWRVQGALGVRTGRMSRVPGVPMPNTAEVSTWRVRRVRTWMIHGVLKFPMVRMEQLPTKGIVEVQGGREVSGVLQSAVALSGAEEDLFCAAPLRGTLDPVYAVLVWDTLARG